MAKIIRTNFFQISLLSVAISLLALGGLILSNSWVLDQTASQAKDVALNDALALCGFTPDGNRYYVNPADIKAVTAADFNPLWIPPTLTGTTFNLTLSKTTKQILPGAATATYGYNGNDFWGPTLIMNKGDRVQMNVTNRLTEETTTHWHGFHIPPETDGGPHQMIAAGTTWSPAFEVKNDAATYWYHPHLHEKTHEQLSYGAGGLIIIKDPLEAALPLPRTYGVDDIPLVLTSRTFLTSNAIVANKIYGDNMLTNGVLNAAVSLPAQFVRFRMLNAEIERAYNLGFSDNRTFYVITTDGGLVNAPVPVTRLIMLPGERYEIMVNLSADAVGKALDLQAFNGGFALGFPGGEPAQTGQFGSLLNNKTFNVLRINVTNRSASGAITALPATLANNTYWTANDATKSRTVAITDRGPGTPFTFDNAGYNMSVINQTVALNTVEKWTITNGQTFGHSFHIHDVQFKIVSRSSGPIPAHQQGWKDTFYIQRNERVEFVAKFDDFASPTYPFMYHCHMSNHEDEGLMGQFLVTGNAPTALTTVSAATFSAASVAAESIAAGFGSNLATATVAATSLPLPTTLGGVTVTVTDSAGTARLAPLFFVSTGQINYLVPAGTATGTAQVTINQGATSVATGTLVVAKVTPGLFSANASGQGVAAATLLRVKASGAQSYEPIAQFDQVTSRYVALPIDLGATTDQLFLVGYGTGFRSRSALSTVTCTIGGTNAEVFFAGAQGDYAGLDQVNLAIPRTLAGRGNVDIVLRVDGTTANTVTLNVK